MINLTIGTNTERKNSIIDVNTTLAQALADNGVSTQGTALYLNSKMLAGCDTEATFADLGVEDGSRAMLIAVVKSENASVSYKDNVLKFVSPITKESIEKGIGEMIVRDEKDPNEILYFASVCGASGEGRIFDTSVAFNTYVDDKAAVIIVLPMGTTKEDVMKQFGEKLIAAEKYTKQIAEAMAAKEKEIEEAFETQAE